MSKKEVLVDTGFLGKLSKDGKSLETFKKVLSDLEYSPVIHPYIAEHELDMYSYIDELKREGFIRVAEYDEFLKDDTDSELYISYFMDIHDILREYLETVGGKKKLEKLVLPSRQTIFSYRKAGMSIGDVHMILMAFFMQMPIILTEDSDIVALRSITRRKMNSGTYVLDIYNVIDLLKMLAQKEDTSFSKNELVDIVKSIGKREHQSEIKQVWNSYHQNT